MLMEFLNNGTVSSVILNSMYPNKNVEHRQFNDADIVFFGC